jgi:hypothetical protein
VRIISPFKDYYDYVGRAQYGEDPTIIYTRSPLEQEQTNAVYKEVNSKYRRIFSRAARTDIPLGWLVFCDQRYMVWWLHGSYGRPEIMSFDNYVALVRPWLPTALSREQAHRTFSNPEPLDLLTELTKQLGQPVYLVCSNAVCTPSGERYVGSIRVQEEIPILKDIGFDKVMRPEQAYLTIYQYLSDIMRDNPDKAPPVEVSNDSKITAHGFDKKSFRKEKAPRGA